jgi:dsDNA-specific endonuclease/ATPase MutS2
MANNFKKVTFIHGIGNGVLKNAITQKLKEYENLQDKSASLAEYGHGAIDVLIH